MKSLSRLYRGTDQRLWSVGEGPRRVCCPWAPNVLATPLFLMSFGPYYAAYGTFHSVLRHACPPVIYAANSPVHGCTKESQQWSKAQNESLYALPLKEPLHQGLWWTDHERTTMPRQRLQSCKLKTNSHFQHFHKVFPTVLFKRPYMNPFVRKWLVFNSFSRAINYVMVTHPIWYDAIFLNFLHSITLLFFFQHCSAE